MSAHLIEAELKKFIQHSEREMQRLNQRVEMLEAELRQLKATLPPQQPGR